MLPTARNISSVIEIPLIGCASHRFNLVVNKWLKNKIKYRGYNYVGHNGKQPSAHRLVHSVINKDRFDPNLDVSHLCGNAACCNPEHLWSEPHDINVLQQRCTVLDSSKGGMVSKFLLAVTEVVNCHNALCFFQNEEKMEQLHFSRDELSDELIDQYLKSKSNEGTLRRRSKQAVSEIIGHKHVSVPPPFKKFKGATLVNLKMRYPTWKCCDLNSRVRTYCIYSPGNYIMCSECYAQHILDTT